MILRLEDWGDRHHPAWMDFIRIILGVFLFIKGFFLFEHSILITNFILTHNLEYLNFMTAQYFILINMGGGLLIASGMLTRFASLLNIPIIVIEAFFAGIPANTAFINSNFALSLMVLALMVLFLVYGSGTISVDNYLNTHEDS